MGLGTVLAGGTRNVERGTDGASSIRKVDVGGGRRFELFRVPRSAFRVREGRG